MVEVYVFGYEYKNREFIPPKIERKIFSPPPVNEKWKGSEENKLFSIIIYNNEKEKKDVNIFIEFSPSIIKGWKIYDFRKVRIIEGGMINERKASLQIKGMKPKERLRVDFLVKMHSLKSLKAYSKGKKIEKIFMYGVG
ncbi:MAG: hypothetical protein FE048_01805 [Thermoplasmata archaeon]|nr:MAG: hypothetical protein FE048_01805 [Thermoplasmata archaeon]